MIDCVATDYNSRRGPGRSCLSRRNVRPSPQWAKQRNGFGEANMEMRGKRTGGRPFPGGCLASNTILPKLDKEMKCFQPLSNAINFP